MKFLFLLISMCACTFSNAATYYISPTGNDATGTGSITNPWKTLRKATNTVTTAGDIIHVNSGTYVESATCTLAPGVSIEGDGVTSIIKASFSTVYQMIIQAHSQEGTNGNQHISNLKFDGQNNTSWAIQIQGRSNFSIHDCTVINFKQRGIVWGGRDDNGDAPPGIYATGNKFYNNIVTNCAGFDGTYGYGCLNVGGQDGMLIYNNTITTTGSMPGWPIKLWNDGYLKGCKIYDNVLKRPPFPYQYNGIGNYFDFCIEFFNQQGLEVYGNTIEGSLDLNYQTKGNYAFSAYIHDNTFGRDVPAAHCETGIWLEFQTENCIIENNTFKNCSQPIMFSLRPGSFMNNITIQKNLAYGIGKTDGSLEGTAIGIIVNNNSTNYSASNWYVYNNTFMALAGSNAPYFGVNIPGGNASSNVNIINNIVSGFNYYSMSCDYGSHVNGLQIKNNTKFNNGSNNNVLFSNGNPANYTYTGNLTSNPNLDGNFIPRPGSPCIDGGINVGLPFSGSNPDIGFFELGVTNTPPTANAGADQSITLPANSVTLIGSGNDPDGFIATYKWTKISGPAAGTITNSNNDTTTVTGLVQGVYKFELKVTDNGGATATDTMQVTVNPSPNLPPSANAGADQTITLPANSVTLIGSGNDPDGFIATYKWTKISGPAAGTITNSNNDTTTVTGLVQGVYKFELKVTDNGGATATDTMQVTVNPSPNLPPSANAGADQTITLPANSVTLIGSGNDPDGFIATYKWTKISGPAAGVIVNDNSSSTSVTGLEQGAYEFELKVTDNNGLSDKDTVLIIIVPAPNILPSADAGLDQTVVFPANSSTLNGIGTDTDGFIVRYSWKQVSGPSSNVLFSTQNASTFINNLVPGEYVFELTVTDNRGDSAADLIKVIVTGPPSFVPDQNLIKVYPNPVIDFTTLEVKSVKSKTNLTVLIYDMQGKMVLKKEILANHYNIVEKLDLGKLFKGTYLVTVYFDDSDKQTLKIVKM